MPVTIATVLSDDTDSSQVSSHLHPLRSHGDSPVIPFPDFQDQSTLPARVAGSFSSCCRTDHPRSRWSESTRDTAFDSIIDQSTQSVPVSPYSAFSGSFPSPRTKTGLHGSPLAGPSPNDGFPIIPTRPPLTPTVTDPTFYEIDWKSENRVATDEIPDVPIPCTATEISHSHLLIVLYLLVFIHGMNTTALVGLLSHVVDDYQCSLMQAFWTMTAYLLSTVFSPTLFPTLPYASALKTTLLASSAIFTGGSLLCALAPTYHTFLLGRILQGLSCGLGICLLTRSVTSLLSTRISYTTPSLVFWIGATGAPLVGAALTIVAWRHLFWLSTGVGAVTLVVAAVAKIPAVTDSPAVERRSTAWALALASTLLVSVAVGWTGTLHAFNSWPVLVPLIPGLLLALAALIHVCWRGQLYLRPLAFLRSSTLLVQGFVFSSVIYLLPFLLQSSSTLLSSLKLLPLLAGILLSTSLISLVLPHLNQQLATTTSSILTTTSIGLLLIIHPTSALRATIPLLACLGVALGSLHSSTASALPSHPHTLGMALGLVLASSIYLNNSNSPTPFRPIWITSATFSAIISVSQIAIAVWDVRYMRKACE